LSIRSRIRAAASSAVACRVWRDTLAPSTPDPSNRPGRPIPPTPGHRRHHEQLPIQPGWPRRAHSAAQPSGPRSSPQRNVAANPRPLSRGATSRTQSGQSARGPVGRPLKTCNARSNSRGFSLIATVSGSRGSFIASLRFVWAGIGPRDDRPTVEVRNWSAGQESGSRPADQPHPARSLRASAGTPPRWASPAVSAGAEGPHLIRPASRAPVRSRLLSSGKAAPTSA
jgi:hypothetical protein